MATNIRTRRPPRSAAGMTLIELMTVILIAAILTAVAVPSYTSQMRKSRRTEAKTALLDLAGREERYYATNTKYSSTPSDLGYSGTAFPVNVGSNYYQINVTAASATAFTATATPINSQTSDTVCATYTLDNTGVQSVSGTGSNATCW